MSIAVAGAGIFICYPRFRRVVILLLVACLVLRYASRNSGMVTPVSDRMKQTDESRVAYNLAGWEIIHSRFWDPLFGVGYFRAAGVMPSLRVSGADDDVLTLWGGAEKTLGEVMEGGHPLHNTFLSTLVEMGAGAAILGICLGLNLVWSLWRLYHQYRRKGDVDFLLAICLTGGILAWLIAAHYHNGSLLETSLAVLWFLYGIVVGRPDVLTLPAKEAAQVEPKVAEDEGTLLRLPLLNQWDRIKWPGIDADNTASGPGSSLGGFVSRP
jgi:hypothetical protein